ncbi:hypothetical protein TrCOL_g2519 [Triparma columacea]|uniref:Cyclic nucleotide-binding domain-containing protein n=1 Tax=Triparma columacea TaxID=722753 RepID=A0A9W7G9J7_9STRA|nr:hypothetical protein TrCOL_g2519 [Triparma columacea]
MSEGLTSKDPKMEKLILLCSSPPQERNVDEILRIVQEEAPNLLNGLAMSNNRNIARHLEIKCYANDEVVFLQNAYPDAYYTVLRGAVSIYAIMKGVKHSAEDLAINNRLQYGKFLVQLRNGAGFGELSFNGDLNHTPRNAGVVSDGYASQSIIESLAADEKKEKGCILLLIPERTYMSEMYALHASKNQTKHKIKFLKMCFLFNTWSMDELVRMAYAMKRKEIVKNGALVKQGDKAEYVFLVIKGKVKLSINSEATLKNASGEKIGTANKMVEIAELSEGDIVGLVEAFDGKKTMERSIHAIGAGVEVFCCNMQNFELMLRQVPKTYKLVEKIVLRRKHWETLRTEYANNFPMMKCTLPDNAVEMSKYKLSRESTMSEGELRILTEKKNSLFQNLREARSNYRTAVTKVKVKNYPKAIEAFEVSKSRCEKALAIAENIQQLELVHQAEDILAEVNEQLILYSTYEGGVPPTGGVEKQTSGSRLNSRRGSATLVAMRIRTLSVDSNAGMDGSPQRRASVGDKTGPHSKPPDPAAAAEELPLSPDTQHSISQSRSHRRRSIAELAAKAGLEKEFSQMEEKRAGEIVTSPGGSPMKSPGGTVLRTPGRPSLKIEKEDSFYHLLKKPSPPSKGRKNSTSGRRDSNNSVRRKRSISDGEEKRKSSLIGRIGSGIGSVLKKVK